MNTSYSWSSKEILPKVCTCCQSVLCTNGYTCLSVFLSVGTTTTNTPPAHLPYKKLKGPVRRTTTKKKDKCPTIPFFISLSIILAKIIIVLFFIYELASYFTVAHCEEAHSHNLFYLLRFPPFLLFRKDMF